jgi:hypothetical protein
MPGSPLSFPVSISTIAWDDTSVASRASVTSACATVDP